MQSNRNDFVFLFLVLFLTTLGIVFSYSASNSIAFRLTGDYYFFFKRHLGAVVFGALVFLIAWRLEVLVLLEGYKIAILSSVVLLLLVFIPGVSKQMAGASRWVDLKLFSFQASELAKIGLILYLSVILPLKKDRLGDFTKGTLPPMVVAGLLVLLIASQPDVSTSLLFLLVSLWMFFLAGIPIIHLLTVVVGSLPFFLILMEIKKYVVHRFVAFDPFVDPFGRGYHLIQSFISFQNGSLLGMGPGESTQKLRNLPEAHTDFVFSIIAEETGLLGACLVMGAFALLVHRGFKVAIKQRDIRLALLAQGIIAFIAIEAIIHFFVALGTGPYHRIATAFYQLWSHLHVGSFIYGRAAYEFVSATLAGISKNGFEYSPP